MRHANPGGTPFLSSNTAVSRRQTRSFWQRVYTGCVGHVHGLP